MKGKVFQGIIPPMTTPLTIDYSIDIDGLANQIDFLITKGVDGLFILGSSGECVNLTHNVCDNLIRKTVELVNGRIPILCGAIEPSTLRVIERIKVLEDYGVDAFVVTPSFYLQNSDQEEIVKHFEKITCATSKNIVVYNIPGMVHVNIQPKTIYEISHIDNIVGYKDSCNDFEQLQREAFLLKETKISFFNGAEELSGAALIIGADGNVPGLANYFPSLFVQQYIAAKQRNINRVIELQKKINTVRTALFVGKHWMSAMKYIASRMGFGQNITAPTVYPLSDNEKLAIDKIIAPFVEKSF